LGGARGIEPGRRRERREDQPPAITSLEKEQFSIL